LQKIWVIAFIVLFAFSCDRYTPTFTKDIAPIIFENCTPCHRDEGAAPFSLTNFNQVNRKKKTILEVTQSGYMPPWPADRNYSHFIGERYLTSEQKELIKRWIETGAVEGKPEDLPPPLTFSSVSRIGEPDTTVRFDSIFIEGNSRDRFFIATLPIELPEDKYVRAMEFLPNKNNLVHHMNGRLLNYEDDKKETVFER
jgi:hypothetical protein